MNFYAKKIGKYCLKYNIFFTNIDNYLSKYKNKKINWPYLSQFLSKKYNNFILNNLDKIDMRILAQCNDILDSTFEKWCESKYYTKIFYHKYHFILSENKNKLNKLLEYCIKKDIFEKDVFTFFSLDDKFIENLYNKPIENSPPEIYNKINNLSEDFILDFYISTDKSCDFLEYRKFNEEFLLKLLEKHNEISFNNCGKNIFEYQYLTPKIFEKIFNEKNRLELQKYKPYDAILFIFGLIFRQKLSKNMIIKLCEIYKKSDVEKEIISLIVLNQYKYHKNFNFIKEYVDWNYISSLVNLTFDFKEKFVHNLKMIIL